MLNLFWIFTLSVLVPDVRSEPYYEVEDKLRESLFEHYNKDVPPLADVKDNVTVDVGISLLNVVELDVTNEVLKTHVWFKMSWTDIRLTWEPSKYNGQQYIAVPIGYLWKPDIILHNNAGQFSPDTDYMAQLFCDGNVGYLPHVSLTTVCPVNLRQFPFDEHTCELKFGSWSYTTETVSPVTGSFDITPYESGNLWVLTNYSHEVITQKYSCCPERYSFYVAKLTLRRRTGLVMNMYIAPAVCMSLLLPSVFLLPPGSTSKLVLGAAVFVGQVLMLEMLVEILPVNHFTVPKLAVYYLINIVLISLSLMMSAVIICLWQRSRVNGVHVPRLVDKIFLGGLGRLLCVRREQYVSDNEGEDVNKGQMTSDDQLKNIHLVAPAEWRQLAAILDRLLLIVFLVIALFTTIALLSTAKRS